MPNRNSAKKRLKQNEERRDRNRGKRSAMRTQLRKVREAVAAGDFDKAETEFRVAVQRLDRAGSSNLIHPNTAARTKSRLSKMIKTAKQAASA